MEMLQVPYYNHDPDKNIAEVSCGLDGVSRHVIDKLLWSESAQKPRVSFSIAHTDGAILLKYFVCENRILVSSFIDNSDVHRDSCVEFFISFGGDGDYYNFEFNAVGICHLGFGKKRSGRRVIPPGVISHVKRYAIIRSCIEQGEPAVNWELTVIIPFDVFIYHKITSLKGISCSGNFYKCGDALPKPHFLSWQKIETMTPDFHLPQFFGSMQFI